MARHACGRMGLLRLQTAVSPVTATRPVATRSSGRLPRNAGERSRRRLARSTSRFSASFWAGAVAAVPLAVVMCCARGLVIMSIDRWLVGSDALNTGPGLRGGCMTKSDEGAARPKPALSLPQACSRPRGGDIRRRG